MRDPLWKTTLCWLAVISFFALPACVFTLQVFSVTHPGWMDMTLTKELVEPHIAYLQSFQRDVTFIVMGLAGLRAIEQIRANGNGKKHES